MADENRTHDYAAACAAHALLATRAAALPVDDVDAVLNFGAEVVDHGRREAEVLGPVWQWVDPLVRAELASQHARLAHDLRFLAELKAGDTAAADVRLLGGSIGRRLRDHVARDQRTLYRPLARLLESRRGLAASDQGRQKNDRYDDSHTAREHPGAG